VAACMRFLLHRPFPALAWRLCADCRLRCRGRRPRGDCPRVLRYAHARTNPCAPPNMPMKHETLNMKQMQYTFKTTETFKRCTCNICMKHMKHVGKTLATYICSRWNISVYVLKHLDVFLQHQGKQLAIFISNSWNTWNIHLQHNVTLLLERVDTRYFKLWTKA
jgi:hypothetical protein